jgi:hypothetical protein
MALLQRLREDLKQALRKGEKERVSVLRLMLASINNAEIAKGGPLDDASILGVIAKQAKQHRESIEAFSKGNRVDLVAKEEEQLAILQEYLPKPMSPEEITTAARQVIEEVEARGPGDKGEVMSKLMSQLKGKAEGSEVSAIVSELLASL